jgi:hypothetical protein
MKYSKIQIGRQGNFIFGLILLYFVFFGYIANAFPRTLDQTTIPASTVQTTIGEKLLFLYQIMFNPSTFWAFIILFGIIFLVSYRESFYEYAIRNSLWYIPAILIISWIWYWIIYGFDPVVFIIYFIRIEGYLTIISLVCINLLAAITASVVNETRKEIIKKDY